MKKLILMTVLILGLASCSSPAVESTVKAVDSVTTVKVDTAATDSVKVAAEVK